MAFFIKPFFVIAILISVIFSYFWVDDAINPEANYWINYYQQQDNIDQNAFIYLIGLNNDGISANALGKQKYQQFAKRQLEDNLDITEKLTYPDSRLFPDVEADPLLCDLNNDHCLLYLADNKDEIHALINFYQPILKQYRQVESLNNFSAINTEFTQSDFVFNTLSRIASLETLTAIWDQDFARANNLLINQIKIERAFMTNAFTVEFKIFPIIQVDSLYTPLIQLLVAQQKAQTTELIKVLQPLTEDEFSFKKVWMKLFTDNISVLRDESLYQDIRENFPEYNAVPLKLLYKTNMTINSMFAHHAVNSAVTLSPKATLTSRLASETLAMDNHQSNILTQYRNIIGDEFALASAPRYLDINNGLIEFDLKLSLLRLMLHSQQQPLNNLLNTTEATNPYLNNQAFIDSDEQQLCHNSIQDTVCLQLH